MSVQLHLLNDAPETGIPFVLEVSGEESAPLPSEIAIRPLDGQGIAPFSAPLTLQGNSKGSVELAFALAGRYEVSTQGARLPFFVKERQNLGFGAEFGVFSLAVALIVGGMIAWLKNKNHKRPRVA